MHKFSLEEIEWLKVNAQGKRWEVVTELFNKRFNSDLTKRQICDAAKRRKIKNGIDPRFKNGHKPYKHKPVGSERINVFGYIEIKVAEPREWRLKHQVVWEENNGPIPKDYILIFGDGNKLNCNIDNLLLVSRKQLLIMNNNQLIKDDTELTKTGVIIASVIQKIHENKKRMERFN